MLETISQYSTDKSSQRRVQPYATQKKKRHLKPNSKKDKDEKYHKTALDKTLNIKGCARHTGYYNENL